MTNQPVNLGEMSQRLERMLNQSPGRPRPSRRMSAPRDIRDAPSPPQTVRDQLSTSLPAQWEPDAQAPTVEDLQESYNKVLARSKLLRQQNAQLLDRNQQMYQMYKSGAERYRQLRQYYNSRNEQCSALAGELQESRTRLKEAIGHLDKSEREAEQLELEKQSKNQEVDVLQRQVQKLAAAVFAGRKPQPPQPPRPVKPAVSRQQVKAADVKRFLDEYHVICKALRINPDHSAKSKAGRITTFGKAVDNCIRKGNYNYRRPTYIHLRCVDVLCQEVARSMRETRVTQHYSALSDCRDVLEAELKRAIKTEVAERRRLGPNIRR